jgi:hypothetical protein
LCTPIQPEEKPPRLPSQNATASDNLMSAQKDRRLCNPFYKWLAKTTD